MFSAGGVLCLLLVVLRFFLCFLLVVLWSFAFFAGGALVLVFSAAGVWCFGAGVFFWRCFSSFFVVAAVVVAVVVLLLLVVFWLHCYCCGVLLFILHSIIVPVLPSICFSPALLPSTSLILFIHPWTRRVILTCGVLWSDNFW